MAVAGKIAAFYIDSPVTIGEGMKNGGEIRRLVNYSLYRTTSHSTIYD